MQKGRQVHFLFKAEFVINFGAAVNLPIVFESLQMQMQHRREGDKADALVSVLQ